MKPELLEQLRSLAPRWTAERAAAVRDGMAARARARARRRVLAGAMVALACVAAAFALRAGRPEEVEVVLAAPETRWREVSASATLRVFAVDAGGVWFSVTRRPGRVVRVLAGEVEVEVVGTRFLVERVEGRVRVAVDHGRVLVRVGEALRELHDGDDASFPMHGTAPQAPRPPEPKPAPPDQAPPPPNGQATVPPVNRVRPSQRPTSSERWRKLAEAGEYASAWTALEHAPPLADEPVELLLAADVARLSRHPEGAVAPLERLLARAPTDARAPLAAFTLGRVLLDELGRPREAAVAFARVRQLDPGNALAEDALAREVEAHDRAGEPTKARALATEYLQRYPTGSRLRAVRHFGGLE